MHPSSTHPPSDDRTTVERPSPRRSGHRWQTALAVGAPLVMLAAVAIKRANQYNRRPHPWLIGLAIVAVVMVVVSVVLAIRRVNDTDPSRPRRPPVGALVTSLVSLGIVTLAGVVLAIAISQTTTIVTGRPLRRGRRRARVRTMVTLRPEAFGLPAGTPLARSSRWQGAAVGEWESVASFLQLAAELAAVGAPDELVARARDAAVEEIDHARRCVLLAAAEGDEASLGTLVVQPRVSRSRSLALGRLAVESLEDGCFNEGAAAMELVIEAESETPAVGRELLAIASDELGHADLAWQIVEWARSAGGPLVDAAVRASARRLSVTTPDDRPVPTSPRAWCRASVRSEILSRIGPEVLAA